MNIEDRINQYFLADTIFRHIEGMKIDPRLESYGINSRWIERLLQAYNAKESADHMTVYESEWAGDESMVRSAYQRVRECMEDAEREYNEVRKEVKINVTSWDIELALIRERYYYATWKDLPEVLRGCPQCKSQSSPISAQRNPKVSVGDILFADNTTLPLSECSMTEKTPVGVVFFVFDCGQHGWAVNLKEHGKFVWAAGEKLHCSIGRTCCRDHKSAFQDFDGYGNTKFIRSCAFGKESSYPAAYAMDLADGWYLPSSGQLTVLRDRIGVVNKSLERIGDIVAADAYWSSTAYSHPDYKLTWISLRNGFLSICETDEPLPVRSVKSF